jgi:hypothetical protein
MAKAVDWLKKKVAKRSKMSCLTRLKVRLVKASDGPISR